MKNKLTIYISIKLFRVCIKWAKNPISTIWQRHDFPIMHEDHIEDVILKDMWPICMDSHS